MTDEPLIGLSKEGEDKIIDVDVTDCFQAIVIPDLNLNMKFVEKLAGVIKPPTKPKDDGPGKQGTFTF